MAQLRLHLVERRALAHEFDNMGVTQPVQVHPPAEAGAAGEALHRVPAVAEVEGPPAQRAEERGPRTQAERAPPLEPGVDPGSSPPNFI